jgi:predicted small secreted protein
MKKLYNLLALVAVAAVVAGCGTTSNLKSVAGADIQSLQKYSQVSVLDFGDKTGGKNDATRQRLQEQGRRFADLLARELEGTRAFEKVTHTATPLPGSLLVSGDITRCTEGSASLRLWIGMGAGSSYFDATVEFSDADTAQKLGEILVDKNSWGLGGAIAAGQTVESFMQGAANTIAKQVAKAKTDAMAGK